MPAYSCDYLESTSKSQRTLGLLTVRAAQFVSASGSQRERDCWAQTFVSRASDGG
jgi:hypothetical protein